MITKYTAYIAASIDGRIAESPHSGVNFTSREDSSFFQRALKHAGVVVVGRNTFKIAEKGLRQRNTIVLTSRVTEPTISGSVTFFNPERFNIEEFIQNKKYKHVAIAGGPHVYNFFLEHRMLTELFVTIEPYIFGTGVPMFQGSSFKKFPLYLRSVKRLNKQGTLLLRYTYEN